MRSSGILLHISSLPSGYSIGDLGPAAFDFVDFLNEAGQRLWQVLPINPTDGINGHSPYSCFSAFAGNPLLVSPQMMVKDGFLHDKDLRHIPVHTLPHVDYVKSAVFKHKLFDLAFSRWLRGADRQDFNTFCKERRGWLEDYAAFMIAKEVYKGKCWNEWPAGLRNRQKKSLANFVRTYKNKIEQVKFVQYLFFRQWHRLKQYANSWQVQIIGDIPIYVNYDSADVWCHRSLFKLTTSGQLKFVSGCPPDYFSKTGQRWGNPVYDWAKIKKDKYRWWVARIQHNLQLFDYLRIDHFRGFVSYWQIPAHEKFAVFGRWVKGPGRDFFKVLKNSFEHLPIVAEDLGEITKDVTTLMRDFAFPSMRVLLFGFNGNMDTNPHVPAHYPANCVAYTGTHDNNTVRGWLRQEAKPHEIANVPKVLNVSTFKASQLHWLMIGAVMASKARMAVIPLSDVLGLGEEARMNTPATKANNWLWMLHKPLSKTVIRTLLKITRASKRV